MHSRKVLFVLFFIYFVFYSYKPFSYLSNIGMAVAKSKNVCLYSLKISV